MAGPYKDKTGPSVEEAISAGLGEAGLGAPAVTTTTGAPPPIPPTGNPARGFKLGVQAPSWASVPSQADFGQKDTRQDNYDTGLVVTPQQGYAFPALANRQMGNELRKQALAKKVADFNLYSGIGQAHPRYESAWSKYAVGANDQWLQEQADARFGGDRRAAVEWASTDPEGQQAWNRQNTLLEAVATENKATVQDSINTLAKVTGEGMYVPPEKLKLVVEHANAVDHNMMPVKGQSADEFLSRVRNADATMQEIQYVNKVLDPILKDAFSTTTGFDIGSKKVGGKYVLTETETKSFHDAIDHAIEMNPGYVEAYYGGDKEKAKEGIEEYYPISVKKTTKLESPYTPPQQNTSGSAAGPKGAPTEYVVDQTQLPFGLFRARNPDIITKLSEIKTASHPEGYTEDQIQEEIAKRYPDLANKSYPTYPLFDITSEQGRTAQPRPFTDGKESPNMIPTRVMNLDGKLFIVGKAAPEQGARPGDPVSNGGIEQGNYGVERYQDYNSLPDIMVPYEENKGRLSQYFPWIEDAKLRSALGLRTSSFKGDQPAAAGYTIGQEDQGYRYLGGDPTDAQNWKQIK